MTVQSAASRNSYTASGGTTFPYTFLCLLSTDLTVYDNSNVVSSALYTVTNVGTAAGGNVVFTSAPTSGHTIIILSNAAYTQGLDLVENDPLPANSLETALDRDTILAKQLLEITNRAPKFDIFACDSNIALNSVVGQAGKVASVASSEKRIEWVSVSTAQGTGTGTFTQSGTGAVSRSILNKLTDFVSVMDFGALGDNATDDRAAIQAALNAHLRVYFPAGTYRCTAPLTIRAGHTLWGVGPLTSIIRADHNGDGVQSTWTINASNAVNLRVEDLGITCTNGTNTGGGFADVAGSFIYLTRVKVSGFKYQVIFDQTEVSYITECDLEAGAANATAGLWLVNGADHTALASPFFTNVIAVRNTQFNAAGTAVNVIDDGGTTHSFENCNFNAGAQAMLIAATYGLRITGCHSEGHTAVPFALRDTTVGGTFQRLPMTTLFEGNTVADAVTYHIQAFAAQGLTIRRNTFGQFTTAAFVTSADKVTGVVFGDNDKIIQGAARTAAPFIDGSTARLLAFDNYQQNQTYATSGAIAAGSRTITPGAMGFAGSLERIDAGDQLYCVATDGTNAEIVAVTSVTSSTFTATFASSKDANFLIIAAAKGTPVQTGTPVAHGLYDQSLIKAAIVFDGTAVNPISPGFAYNINDARVTKFGTGDYCVSFQRVFATGTYLLLGGAADNGAADFFTVTITTNNAGCCRFRVRNGTGVLSDKNAVSVIWLGTQA